jgi:hypothetical protein
MIVHGEQGVSLADLAVAKGYKVESPSRDMVKQGIDLHLQGIYKDKNKEIKLLVSIKRRKTNKKSKYLDRWTWIEYKGSGGRDGWIYGPAHFVAFERSDDYVIVNRKVLLEFLNSNKCRVRWDLPFVRSPKEAKYLIYSNPKTLAQITQILTKDVIKLKGAQVWSKNG